MRFRKGLYVIMALLGITSCVFFWADNELNKVLGKSTKVIAVSSMVKQAETIIIKNTNVLSEDCSHFIKNQDVAIKNGKIIHLGTHQSIEKKCRYTRRNKQVFNPRAYRFARAFKRK